MYSALLERKKAARQIEDMTIDKLNMDVLHEISSYISINDTFNFVKAFSWRLQDMWALIKIKKANLDFYNCGKCLTCLYRVHRVYKEYLITMILILNPVTIPRNNAIWSH